MPTNNDLKRWYGDNATKTGEDFARVKDAKIDIDDLVDKLEGDEFITVDENAAGTKVAISLDANYKLWYVELTGSSGTLTDTQFTQLTTSVEAKIICDDEVYTLSDVQDSFTVYSHVGRDNQQEIYAKVIYIFTDSSAVTYKTWSRVSTNLSLLPVPESADLGKFLKVATTGLMYGSIPVSGTNDGTNWTALTIDGVNKAIPQGGGGGNLYQHNISIEVRAGGTYTGGRLRIITSNSTPFSSMSMLAHYLYTNMARDRYSGIPFIFPVSYTEGYFTVIDSYLYSDDDASVSAWTRCLGTQSAGVTSYQDVNVGYVLGSSITDTVVQL